MSRKIVCDHCGKIIEDTYYDRVHITAKWDEKEGSEYYSGRSLELDFCKKCFSELQEHSWFINFK